MTAPTTEAAQSRIRRPHAVSSSYTPVQVATAYHYPKGLTGKGYTAGVIELGGGFKAADFPYVTAVPVAGGSNTPDGPNGADGEVQLDIEVIHAVAPGARIRCYFAANTDAGFLAAIKQAASECDVVSISWGQAESQWSLASLGEFDKAFLAARKAGCIVFAAAGDSGSTDSTSADSVDFPASSPNVIGCGGTRLTVDASGTRTAEVAWNDNPTTSATGGGISRHFPGRQVPDVAGNADPNTGYQVQVDGQQFVIGGTSAVAPLYAGLVLLLCEAIAGPLGRRVDLLNTLLTNPGVFYDVTAGNNGGYRAGVGRDDVTGLGVVDGSKLLAVLTSGNQLPAPVPTPSPPAPTPQPAPTPSPTPASATVTLTGPDTAILDKWAAARHTGSNNLAAQAWQRGVR